MMTYEKPQYVLLQTAQGKNTARMNSARISKERSNKPTPPHRATNSLRITPFLNQKTIGESHDSPPTEKTMTSVHSQFKGKLLRRRHSCPQTKASSPSVLKLKEKIRKPPPSQKTPNEEVTLHYPTPKLNYELFSIDGGNATVKRVTLTKISPRLDFESQHDHSSLTDISANSTDQHDGATRTPRSARHGASNTPVLPHPTTLNRRGASTNPRPQKNVPPEKKVVEKNEAEIIEPEFFRGRNSTFGEPDNLATNFRASGGVLIRSALRNNDRRRSSITDSVDRVMRSMYRNTLEDKRLERSVTSLEKQSQLGNLELRQRKQKLFNQQKKMAKTSPTTDQWLDLRRSYTSALQEHGRQDIARRYSRRARQFRAPKDLRATVSKIRNYAMIEAGLVPTNEIPQDDDADEVTEDMATLDVNERPETPTFAEVEIRRHSLNEGDTYEDQSTPSSDEQAPLRPQLLRSNTQTDFSRRMTMADLQSVKDVLQFRALHMSKMYADDALNNDEDDGEEDGKEGETGRGGNGDNKEKRRITLSEVVNVAKEGNGRNETQVGERAEENGSETGDDDLFNDLDEDFSSEDNDSNYTWESKP